MCVTNPHLFTCNKSDEALYVETKFYCLLSDTVIQTYQIGGWQVLCIGCQCKALDSLQSRTILTNDEILHLASGDLEQ